MMNIFGVVIVLLLASATHGFVCPSVGRNRESCELRPIEWRQSASAALRVPTSRIFLNTVDADSTAILDTKRGLNSTSSSGITTTGEGEVATVDINENDNAYVRFAKEYPFVNNFIIASLKTTAADLLAQLVIAHTPVAELDLQRSLLFCAFGGIYSGAFQYVYQVNVFKKLFDVDKFTSQSWSQKLRDIPGIRALAAQTGLDLAVLTLIYLPAFYIFKASIFSGSSNPSDWISAGVGTYTMNFGKDEADLLKVWLPADLICFSVPLYLRMPVRHSVSFLWTAYLSFARGGH